MDPFSSGNAHIPYVSLGKQMFSKIFAIFLGYAFLEVAIRVDPGFPLSRKRSPQGGARANLPWPFYRYRLSFAATIRRARVTCFRSAL